ncbi:MAG: type I glutamate--ammonia ligase [Candidatus Paceibacterota bacterium]|jgi:glutamine synthetase
MAYEEIIDTCKKRDIKLVDLKFCDLPGTWQHFTLPLDQLDKKAFEEGIGFDGSSIRGFKEIQESDMLLVPDINTVTTDPFSKFPLASFICDVYEPGAVKKAFENDPRFVAKKAEEFLVESGLADKAYFGPEAEFFIFDKVNFGSGPNFSFHEIKSAEANWDAKEDKDLPGNGHGYKIRNKEGYFPVPPTDQLADIRREMVFEMKKFGIEVEKEHHEVSTGGQAEIDIKYDTLKKIADKTMAFKYVVKNVAFRNGKTATFMPKPIWGDNGSGMHVHVSLWKEGVPLFHDKGGYSNLSEMAIYFIGGLLKHAPAILAFAAPTTNSYKRLVPGFEAPVNLAYSGRNRSAAIRIPAYSDSPAATRIEFRPPDPSANPYLLFSAMLLAGLDGVKNKIKPMDPINENIYKMDKSRDIPQVPDSLDKSLAALEKDSDFLTKDGVFAKELIATWINYKKTAEYDFIRTRPSPAEFALYYDV